MIQSYPNGEPVILDQRDISRCAEFSRRCAVNQQAIEFGQHDTRPRTIEELARDNLIGKLGEVAFQKFIEERYKIRFELDFSYYPRGEWDKQDILYNGFRIDVKGVRYGAKWLLVELNKIDFRKKENRLPDFYVSVVVGWDRTNDICTGSAWIMGYVASMRMDWGQKGTSFFKKGQLLPRTKTLLQADNFGIPFKDLQTNWDRFMQILNNGKDETYPQHGA